MWRGQNPCVQFVEMLNGVATVENNMVVPQKIKHRITTSHDPETPLLGIYPKDLQ